ncbi:MAG: hypothetical protein ACRDIE_03425 [Chloroflexota bacterium]
MAEQVNWELDILNNPEAYREWLQTQANRGIEHLREDGALMRLMGGPTATSHLQLHLASGCVFHLLTNFRGMLVAINLATEATRELVSESEIRDEGLEAWILAQEWRSLMSVEVPLGNLNLPNQYSSEFDADVEYDGMDSLGDEAEDIQHPDYDLGPLEVDGACAEEKWAELGRWQREAITALQTTGSACIPFQGFTVTRGEVIMVNGDLMDAKTPEDVRKAFDWKFEGLRRCR